MKLKGLITVALLSAWAIGGYSQLSYGWEKEIQQTQEFTYQKNKKAKQPGAAQSKSYKYAAKRPDHINNALLKYYPPVFSQDQGSCDAAAYCGYQFTYERNNYYGLDGSLDENRFTSHFNYLLAHNYQGTGKAEMLQNVGNPSVADYGGQTYSKYFGNQTCEDTNYGWMQGYDKWYRTAHNRDWTTASIYSVMTEEGRETLKNWLWNHNGDYDFPAGGVAWFGMAALDIKVGKIPETATNKALGLVGKYYIGEWGPSYNHAQTIVGYDDRIEFDLDSNGIYGEKDKDEVGAWIICNSWGNGWLNNGFVYCPYARAYTTIRHNGSWTPVRHYIRKDYEPLRMLKVKLAYSKRSMISLSVTATQDTASNIAQDSLPLDHFRFAGDGSRNRNNPPATPMLGKWVDGYHYEPMEFGYDISSITENFDRSKPIKYFFNIFTMTGISDENCGTGRLHSASIIDYELSPAGIEFPFKVEDVQITGSGKLYRVSVIVPGEQINPPLNLTLDNATLHWQAPASSSLPVNKYYIYYDDAVIDSVDAATLSYTAQLSPSRSRDAAFSVSAVYDYRGNPIVSEKTNRVMFLAEESDTANYVLDMRHTLATADNLEIPSSKAMTLEYWIKPYSLSNYSDQIGNGQTIFSSMSVNRGVLGGWNSNYSYASGSSAGITLDKWSHVAVRIDGPDVDIFVDGVLKRSGHSYGQSGIRPFSNFFIGQAEDDGLMNGQIDELRLWNRALTDKEIQLNRLSALATPSQQDELVLYYKGNTFEKDGNVYIRDYARGHHALIQDPDSVSLVADNSFLTGNADFALSIGSLDTVFYATMPIKMSAALPAAATAVVWDIDGIDSTRQTAFSPYLAFPTEGSHTVNLTVTGKNGQTYTAQRTFEVKALPAPKADFDITKNNLPASESFSFVNRSIATNATYTWKMPGADIETVRATNASARFLQVGSYPVTLVVSNAAGTDSITKQITAVASAPYVDFSVSPSAILLGDKVFFQDKSNYDPTYWQWEVNHTSGKRNYAVIAQNTAFTPLAPGYYNVTLKASNAQGATSATQKKVFAVSNADPGNGLQMTGSGERFALSSPFTAATRAFTIDTWLYPTDFNGALTMSTDDGGFKTKSNSDGSVSITVNGKTTKSDAGYLIQDEWHHYAITFSTGNVKFYRDAELFSAPTLRLGLNCPAWAGSLTVSSDTARFKGMIDEFRIWSKALNAAQLQSYCNQPIATDEIDAAKTQHGLKVYYQFNQNSGDITDASGNGYTATILDLPAVDPWTSALGVFTLDFGGDEPSDVSADYLTNYKAPFLDNGQTVSSSNSNNLRGLKTGTEDSKWVVANTVQTEKSTTGAHIYKTLNSDLNFRTGYYGFADTLKNHLLYQTAHLPAGYYTLTVTPSEGGAWTADSSYICVVKGDEFVDMSNYETKADAYTSLANNSLTFSVGEEQDITIGLIVNLTGWNAIDINEFKLMRTPMTEVEPDDQTSVYSAVKEGSMHRYTPVTNGIRVINETLRPMKVYTVDGRLVFNEMVEGVHIIPFMPGIYLIDGEKIQVK